MSFATPASKASSSKTPHRRRRKVPVVSPKATPAVSVPVQARVLVDNKENNSHSQSHSHSHSRNGSNANAASDLLLDDDDVIFLKAGRDKTITMDEPASASSSSATAVLSETVLEFRSALSSVTSSNSSSDTSSSLGMLSLFQEHPNLDESVIRCSLFPQSATGLWHVQEHSAALLSQSRKLIKQATTTTTTSSNTTTGSGSSSSSSTSLQLLVAPLLLIAVHNLRAVVALQDSCRGEESSSSSKNDVTRIETCIRLLYHLITTASEKFLQQQQQQQQDSTNNKNDDEDSWKLGMIAMAGFEALQSLLLQYSCTSSTTSDEEKRIVRFRSSSRSTGTGNSETSTSFEGVAVAVPSWQRTTTTQTAATAASASASGTMTLRQVATIALKSCLSCASAALLQLWWWKQQHTRTSIAAKNESSEMGRSTTMTMMMARLEAAAARYGDLARLVFQQQHQQQPVLLSSASSSSSSLHQALLDSVLRLLHTCYTPWLTFIADHSKDEECTKDFPAHCKASHRLLWDFAAKLKGSSALFSSSSNNSNNSSKQKMEDSCLELRRHAIEMLLPPVNTSEGIALVQESQCWDSACSYAWKAASVYIQQQELTEVVLPVPIDTALGKFHATVGSQLDRFSSTGTTTHSAATSISFIEYCVYRGLHCGIPPKLHNTTERCWELPILRRKDDEQHIGALVLSAALLGIQSKHVLSGCQQILEMSCHSAQDDDDGDLSPDDYVWDLVAAFESSWVLPRWQSLSEDTQNRYFKLLSTISLHRTIFHALKNNNSSTNNCQESSSNRQKPLKIISMVLSRCVGPLALAMSKSCKDKSKVNSMFELALECYIRPLAAFERLSEESSCQDDHAAQEGEYQSLADETIQTMHRIFFMEDPLSPGLLEKCAKSIALVARQRTDRTRTRASIYPTLYSIPMYQYLSQKSSQSDYQLSARLAHLANALQASGLCHQAMVVLGCVIAQELPTCYACDDLLEWKAIDFVHFLAARCKNVFSPISTEYQPTALARSSIRRLIALTQQLAKNEQSNAESPSIKEDQHAWEAFVTAGIPLQSLDDIQEACSSVASLLPTVLQWQQPKEEPRAWLLGSFLLYVDVMAELGTSMPGALPHESSSSSSSSLQVPWQAEDCHAMAQYLESELIPQLSLKSSPDLLPVLVKVVVSTSLTQSKVDFSRMADDHGERSIDEAIRLADDAVKELESPTWNGDGKGQACCQLLAAVISHFSCYLEARRGDTANAGLFQRYQKSMAVFRKYIAATNDDILEFCRKAFLWTLSHFQIQLESGGDSIRSVVSMHWILELLNEDDADECAWFRSTAVSAFLESPLSMTNMQFEIEERLPRSMEWFAQTELSLASLRAQVSLTGFDCEALPSAELVKSIKLEIEAAEVSTSKRDIISLWLLCSAELTLAECAAATGSFTESLKHLQESCRHCMSVISSSRSGSGHDEDSPFWVNVARSTLGTRANRRYAELLGLRSKLYSRIGDHRKAIAYLVTLADFLGIDVGHVDKELGPNVEAMLASDSDLGLKQFQRLNAEIRCSVSSLDLVANGLEGAGSRWPHEAWSKSDDVARQLQVILDVMSAGDLVYGESIRSPFQSSFSGFYKEAMDWYTTTIASNNLFDAYRSLTDDSSTALSAKMAIREIRCLLHLNSNMDPDTRSKVRALCAQVEENTGAEASDRAWAHYYSAEIEITALHQSGGLGRLWSQNSDDTCQEDEESLQAARDHLSKAATIHAIGSDILSRIILRSLALVTGPETGSTNNASSGSLVLMSIGQSYRQLMVRSLSDANDGSSNHIQALLDMFSVFEANGTSSSGRGIILLLDQLAEVVPANWKFVAATLCPSGDLLVTSIEKDADVGGMYVNTSRVEPKKGDNAYDDIMVPLDEIIRESQSQLYGMDVSVVSERFSKEAAKREWWDKRHKLDEDLQALLERVEGSYFPSLHLKLDSNDSIFQSAEESTSLPIGNLASKFEAAVEETKSKEETSDSLLKLTVPKLKERLRDEYGFPDSKFRKMKKQDLIDLILSESSAGKEVEDVSSDGCLFLILDENLHRFPFEGMPSLEGHSVCRVPSLSFILASLRERNVSRPGQKHLVDPSRASFVLDPESNLISTRKRLKPVLDGISTENDWEWDSAVGQIPQASFFEDGLLRQDSLFMYFGHGGAQTCFSRKQVESLMCQRDDHNARACNATVILMGCSSGRLVSVNRKHSRALEQIPLYYEPEGIALSYLCAGAPCVVGNLWDVTDHDIDRYSTTLLEKFLQGEDRTRSLSSCVATSRSACKLRFIVGCAPVCYGIPVHLRVCS